MADETNLDDNFGAQSEADNTTGGYVANFEGDEIDGKRYKLGERIADGVDPGTIAYLVQNGRISEYAEGAEPVPSGGESGSASHTAASDDDNLDPAVQELVDANSKDELLKLAEDEKVEGVTDSMTKTEIATAIVAARK